MKNFNSNVTTAISAVALILLITVVFLTSCTPVKKKPIVTTNPIADAKNIGRALGCMFGGCDRATQDREFQREFEKIDKSSVLKK